MTNFEAAQFVLQVIGTIATIVSLVYVARQIKENTNATRGNTYQNMVGAVAEFEFAIFQDSEIALLYKKSRTGEKLDEIEKIRVNEIISTYINFYENFHYQYSKKLIDKDLWDGWKQTMVLYVKQPGVQKWWKNNRELYNPKFREMLETEVAKVTEV